MSDFLARMVDRARGRTQTVRPRLPALFETSASTPALESVLPRAPAGTPRRRMEIGGALPVGERPLAGPAPTRRGGTPESREEGGGRRADRPPPALTGDLGTVLEPAPEAPFAETLYGSDPVVAPIAPTGPTPAAGVTAARDAAVPAKRPAAARPARLDARRPPEERDPLRPTVRRAGPSWSVRARRLPTRGRTAAEPAEPAVQVSIGRIDVRAAPPTRREPQRPAASTASRLDDYQRRRAKGSA